MGIKEELEREKAKNASSISNQPSQQSSQGIEQLSNQQEVKETTSVSNTAENKSGEVDTETKENPMSNSPMKDDSLKNGLSLVDSSSPSSSTSINPNRDKTDVDKIEPTSLAQDPFSENEDMKQENVKDVERENLGESDEELTEEEFNTEEKDEGKSEADENEELEAKQDVRFREEKLNEAENRVTEAQLEFEAAQKSLEEAKQNLAKVKKGIFFVYDRDTIVEAEIVDDGNNGVSGAKHIKASIGGQVKVFMNVRPGNAREVGTFYEK